MRAFPAPGLLRHPGWMDTWLPLVAGVGSAAVGGFYVAFSAVVMPALRCRPARDAVATMVAINERAVGPVFMLLFFGTAAASAIVAFRGLTGDLSAWSAAGAAAYLAGWATTMAVNVPLNTRLAGGAGAAQPSALRATDADDRWHTYDQAWTAANHVRAVLSLAGAVALLLPALRG